MSLLKPVIRGRERSQRICHLKYDGYMPDAEKDLIHLADLYATNELLLL